MPQGRRKFRPPDAKRNPLDWKDEPVPSPSKLISPTQLRSGHRRWLWPGAGPHVVCQGQQTAHCQRNCSIAFSYSSPPHPCFTFFLSTPSTADLLVLSLWRSAMVEWWVDQNDPSARAVWEVGVLWEKRRLCPESRNSTLFII